MVEPVVKSSSKKYSDIAPKLKISSIKKCISVEPACVERDIVITTTVQFMCVVAFVCPSKFVPTITSTIVDGLQDNLIQSFSIMS